MAVHKHQFVVDDSGKKTAVILDIEEYQELIDDVEELEAIRARLRRGPRYVRQDIQVPLAPSVSRRVIPSAATVLRSGTPRRYRSRVPSLNDSTPSI